MTNIVKVSKSNPVQQSPSDIKLIFGLNELLMHSLNIKVKQSQNEIRFPETSSLSRRKFCAIFLHGLYNIYRSSSLQTNRCLLTNIRWSSLTLWGFESQTVEFCKLRVGYQDILNKQISYIVVLQLQKQSLTNILWNWLMTKLSRRALTQILINYLFE